MNTCSIRTLNMFETSKLYSNYLAYKVIHPDGIKEKQASVDFWWIFGLVWGRGAFLLFPNRTASSIPAVRYT